MPFAMGKGSFLTWMKRNGMDVVPLLVSYPLRRV